MFLAAFGWTQAIAAGALLVSAVALLRGELRWHADRKQKKSEKKSQEYKAKDLVSARLYGWCSHVEWGAETSIFTVQLRNSGNHTASNIQVFPAGLPTGDLFPGPIAPDGSMTINVPVPANIGPGNWMTASWRDGTGKRAARLFDLPEPP